MGAGNHHMGLLHRKENTRQAMKKMGRYIQAEAGRELVNHRPQQERVETDRKTAEEIKPGNQPKQESNPRPSATPDQKATPLPTELRRCLDVAVVKKNVINLADTFRATECTERKKSVRRPTKVTEDVVEDATESMQRGPNKSVKKLVV
ncbi:hypothetical protein ANN_16007 [Periplaneta americana]|uniref:Uncharacterized protein n=1 Tax=Periplaneta americana TaxID=6978 RepID=A0ABQ8SIP9_PERAM|nr:hypothetical protein ANN_16007 [Periplaneta americana]